MQPVQRINHIAIAVPSIAEARPFYESVLGLQYEGMETVADQKVTVAFFLAGEVRIELLEPTGPDSTVAKFLETRGPGLHHLAFTVGGLAERIAELKAQGVRLIDEQPRGGAHQTAIAFLHPKATGGVLCELTEPKAGH
jgi:methylmalonyl-CoA/ethylmalonyl-CoA epimerase